MSNHYYLLRCLRYIEQNPVRANVVTSPDAYEWSSFRCHGDSHQIQFLTHHDAYLALGQSPTERGAAYRAICGVGLSDEELLSVRVA